MLLTVFFFVVFLDILFASLLLWALCLRWGLRWAKVEGVSWRRVLLATILVFAGQLLIGVLFCTCVS